MRLRSLLEFRKSCGRHQPNPVFFLAVIIAFGLSWSGSAAATTQIKLRTAARVDGESILLGQISDIRSDDPAAADDLGKMEITHAPLPGQSLYIQPNRVEWVLQQKNEAVENCQVIAAGPVKVSRNYHTVSAEQIRSAVAGFIESHAPWSQNQMKIRPIRYDQSHVVPPGNVTLQITAAKHTDWLGAEPFLVRILVDGEVVRRTAVPTYIEVWQEVFLAAKPLGKNQPVTRDDIKTQKMDLARLPSDAVFSFDQVAGKRAIRAIAFNAILRQDQFERAPVVRKGDRVQVLAESALLKISTLAVAQENGCIGDRIELINLNSKKSIYAQVVDAQTVKVAF